MRQVKVAAIQMQCSKNPEENRKKAEKNDTKGSRRRSKYNFASGAV